MKCTSVVVGLITVAALSAFATQLMASAPRRSQFDAWARADANGDGGLSREEAQRMPRLGRRFDAIDGNGDGVISGAEVRAWREARRDGKKAAKPLAPAKGVEEILRIADRDGDGSLSRAEFDRGLPRFARRFERIDTDGDASLSLSELGLWLVTLRSPRRSKQPGQQRQRE